MSEVAVWSGWAVGLAIGLFIGVMLWITNRQLGCSTVYGSFFGLVPGVSLFRTPEYVDQYQWRVWFFLGLPLGGVVAVLTSPETSFQFSFSMGPLYDSVLPEALWARAVWLFLGGFLMGVGARLAGGCTSGHALTGCALLNVPSFVASVCFFVGGLMLVQIIFTFIADL